MHIYLKIKIKTLADEAIHIRKAERQFHVSSRQRKRMKRDLELKKVHTEVSEGFTLESIGTRFGRAKNYSPEQLARIQKKLDRAIIGVTNVKAQNAFWGLRNHRTNEVRKEARSSFIAYGFLRGHNYETIEQGAKKMPDWDRVESLIKKFGEGDVRELLQKFAEWKDAASNT